MEVKRTYDHKAVQAAVAMAGIINDTIKDAGTDGIPSGHLYAMLMGHINLDNYNSIINVLKKAGKIKESNFLLTSA